jgi:hypothetical protein
VFEFEAAEARGPMAGLILLNSSFSLDAGGLLDEDQVLRRG